MKLLKGRQTQTGFTIVELLIVIVIIGILAAITIVAYNGITARANDTAVTSDLSVIAKKIALYKAEFGAYPPDLSTTLLSDPYKVSISKSSYAVGPAVGFNLLYCTSSDFSHYAVTGMTKSSKRLYVGDNTSVTEYTGSADWTTTSNYAAICTGVLAGSVNSGKSGYRADDSTNGPWRSWAADS